jgi:hypothetical protein
MVLENTTTSVEYKYPAAIAMAKEGLLSIPALIAKERATIAIRKAKRSIVKNASTVIVNNLITAVL